MSRRLPAYGRELAHARDTWRGPAIERVWVIVGHDWGRLPQDGFTVCANPDAPADSYDWSLLAGLPVDVVSRDGADIEPFGAEIARWAAPVRLHWLIGEPDWPIPIGAHEADIAEVAFCRRTLTEAGGNWPPWWDDEREALYAQRKLIWRASQAADTLRL